MTDGSAPHSAPADRSDDSGRTDDSGRSDRGESRVGLDSVDLHGRSGGVRWGALALEAGVVVLSILMAFGLESWWQGREQDQVADDLRAALVVDFARNRTSIDSVIMAVDGTVQLANVVLREVIVGGSDLPVDSMVGNYLRMARFTPFLNTNGTYRAAVNSGDIRLLRNDSLAISLANYQEYQEFLTFQDQQVEVLLINGAFARGSLKLGGLVRLEISRQTPATEWTREEFRARLGDPEVMAGIESMLIMEQTRRQLLCGLRGRIDRILGLLREDMAKAVAVGAMKAPPSRGALTDQICGTGAAPPIPAN